MCNRRGQFLPDNQTTHDSEPSQEARERSRAVWKTRLVVGIDVKVRYKGQTLSKKL